MTILSSIRNIVGNIKSNAFKKILYPKMRLAFGISYSETQIDYNWLNIKPNPKVIKALETRAILLSETTT